MSLFEGAGLHNMAVASLEVVTRNGGFSDFWQLFLQAPGLRQAMFHPWRRASEVFGSSKCWIAARG